MKATEEIQHGPSDAENKEFRLELTLASRINLADFQNAIPPLRELIVVNGTDTHCRDVKLEITSEPAFLKPKQWSFDSIRAGQRYHVTEVDVQLDGSMLSRLTEAEKATVRLRLWTTGSADALCLEERVMELLPRTQWGGRGQLPEMIAAFVQPNDPAVDRILKRASEVLQANGKSGSIEGYTRGPGRAWEIISAIWTAVVGMRIAYSMPPMSFEQEGQKIRGPSQIADSRLATCLDLALLFAAVLEQAALNPVVLLSQGHAIVGVWLVPEDFATAAVEDPTAIRKRIALKELLLFESTLATQKPAVSFSHACNVGARQIADDNDKKFERVIDIHRARRARIRPLAMPTAPGALSADQDREHEEIEFEQAPGSVGPDEIAEISAAPLDPADRLSRWQRKLLDLSLRNPLLNFRASKRAVILEAPDPEALEDALATELTLKLLPYPDLMDGADPRNKRIHELRQREDLRREHARDALERKEVHVRLSKEELEARLVELFRSARNAQEEGGANTLFLAFGFLVWTRQEKPDQRLRAPLILLPITLKRTSIRSGFTIVLHEDEARFNPTLNQMLKQDFKLDLPFGSRELPDGQTGLDIEGIWRTVSSAIRDIPGWEVVKDVVLSTFSFAKYLMWKDLVDRTEQLRQSRVVRHLLDTPAQTYASGVPFPAPESLDREVPPQMVFCPLPADSSQMTAVLAASRGKDFVLIGPPGTGKSQTISNLIAQCLAESKRVLFVAEKKVALEVVYRRLVEVGLGEFCLELHSSKARKIEVLGQLERSWNATANMDHQEWEAEAARLGIVREQLSRYVERLHLRHGNGWSVYRAIGVVVAGESVPDLRFGWPYQFTQDLQGYERLREAAKKVAVNWKHAGPLQEAGGAIVSVKQTEWSPSWQRTVTGEAQKVIAASVELVASWTSLRSRTGLPHCDLARPWRLWLAQLAALLPQAAGHAWDFVAEPSGGEICAQLGDAAQLVRQHHDLTRELSEPWPDALIAELEQGLALLHERNRLVGELGPTMGPNVVEQLQSGFDALEELAQLRSELSVPYSDAIDSLSIHQLHRKWLRANSSFWPISWLVRKQVRKAIDPVVNGPGEPDLGADLPRLIRTRALQEIINALKPGVEAEGVWSGISTRADVGRSVLAVNAALVAVASGQSWGTEGFQFALEGYAGRRWAEEASRLKGLFDLAVAIEASTDLAPRSSGVWAGHATDEKVLRAALDFQKGLRNVKANGRMDDQHPIVARGECGSWLKRDLELLLRRNPIVDRIRSHADLREPSNGLWNALTSDLNEIDRALKFGEDLRTLIARIPNAIESEGTRCAVKRALENHSADEVSGGELWRACDDFANRVRHYNAALTVLVTDAALSEIDGENWMRLPPEEVGTLCTQIIERQNELRDWCAWNATRAEARDAGLTSLVDAAEAASIDAPQVMAAFEVNFCRWWLAAVVGDEPVIRQFVSAEHEQRIQDFRELDDRFTRVTRDWLRARLCAGIPEPHTAERDKDWGILRRELSKKRRQMPVRELIGRIPSVVLQLAPCLLMSPLSVAQYLDTNAETFDVVVFDEASQIPVWDAIGAMARGKQVIMVGDPKQLPPTAFFDRSEDPDASNPSEADLESILDECMGASLPVHRLLWHYRSRHESLIAFSNHRYYGGGLVTFPSPVTADRAVSLHHVSGRYEKGGARINKVEAQAVVADIVQLLKSSDFGRNPKSIGVVTFNAEQQNLIEDLLDEERRRDASIEPFFSENEIEPVFVKNLESVQGDERDIMYFSVTYGPDLTGAISMNFGPLNRQGGERRLNVAITRARLRLKVYSSLRADQMDLSRTNAEGVRDLKHFLDFAGRGTVAIAEANYGIKGDFESPFESAVASALRSRGWQVHPQVGASSFRIDLGIVHPERAGDYVAGVECDGATYHRTATARDRDKLRERILRGLGWEIVRIWSTDWWVNPKGTLERVHQQLSSILETDRAHQAATEKEEQEGESDQEQGQAGASDSRSSMEREDSNSTSPFPFSRDFQVSGTLVTFKAADPREVVKQPNSEVFFEPGYQSTLESMINHVIGVEGPVHVDVLAERIARAHGFLRTGSRIREKVEALASRVADKSQDDVGWFYWKKGAKVSEVVPFRYPSGETAPRSPSEVCMQELVHLAQELLARGCHGEVALGKMAAAFRLGRLREASRKRFAKALELASRSC